MFGSLRTLQDIFCFLGSFLQFSNTNRHRKLIVAITQCDGFNLSNGYPKKCIIIIEGGSPGAGSVNYGKIIMWKHS